MKTRAIYIGKQMFIHHIHLKNLNYTKWVISPITLNLHYVYGELTDYNEDGKGQYYIDGDIDDDDEYYEGRYRCEGADYVDSWLDEVSLDGNYAFYIPENSIPQEKREWYRSHAINNVR